VPETPTVASPSVPKVPFRRSAVRSGLWVVTSITPPSALAPYKTDEAPLTTRMLSRLWMGTVPRLNELKYGSATGTPSMKSEIFDVSRPRMRMPGSFLEPVDTNVPLV